MKYFPLRGMIFEVRGRDSTRYLNSRLTNDIKVLRPGLGCLAAALTPQGRTEGLFGVYRVKEDLYILICDGGSREGVTRALTRYIVADQVEVKDLTEIRTAVHILKCDNKQLVEALAFSPPPTSEHGFSLTEDYIVIARNRLGEFGFDVVCTKESYHRLLSFLRQRAEEIDFSTKERLRIFSGVPEYPADVNEHYIFSESGIEQAISHNKGCYVGQEVIEKARSLGKLPRILKKFTIEGDIAIETGEPVFEGGVSIGKVTSSAKDKEKKEIHCFGYIKTEKARPGASISVKGHSGRISNHEEGD